MKIQPLKKPKKETNKSIKAELDRLLREACFARDKHRCLRCGRADTLAPSHIYPKGRHPRMRHDIENVITYCYACHIHWWHKNPIEANQWLIDNIDPKRLERLKQRAMYVDKSPIDYKLIKISLEQTLNKLTE